MTTKRSSSGKARKALEAAAGGPLSLGMMLRAVREGEGWSLAQMAARLRVTRAAVSAVEHGKAVRVRTAARYAKALGYSPEQFVRLALQDEVRRQGLPYRVELAPELRP